MLVLKWMFGGPDAHPGSSETEASLSTAAAVDTHTPPVLHRGPDTSFLCDVNRPSSENI